MNKKITHICTTPKFHIESLVVKVNHNIVMQHFIERYFELEVVVGIFLTADGRGRGRGRDVRECGMSHAYSHPVKFRDNTYSAPLK